MHRAHHHCTGHKCGQQDDGQLARPATAAPAGALLHHTRCCRGCCACACTLAVPPSDSVDPSCWAVTSKRPRPGNAHWRWMRRQQLGACNSSAQGRALSHLAIPSCLAALSLQALQPWHRLTSLRQTVGASSCPTAALGAGLQAALTCTHSPSRTTDTDKLCTVTLQVRQVMVTKGSGRITNFQVALQHVLRQ